MTFNEHDIEKFITGDLPDDHPAWSQAEAFTQRLDSVFPTASGPLDAAQLAAVVAEAQQVRTASSLRQNLAPVPVKPTRVLLAVAAAAVVAVSSGAGLAAALNGGLNHQAAALKVDAPVSQAAVPTPVATESEVAEEAAPLETEKPKVVHKPVTQKKKSAPKPTKKATESHEDHEDSDDDHEDEHEDEHEDDD